MVQGSLANVKFGMWMKDMEGKKDSSILNAHIWIMDYDFYPPEICVMKLKWIVRIKDWRRNMNDIILYPFLRRFIENEFVFLSSLFFTSFQPRRYLKPQTLWYMYLIEGRFREISNFKIFRVRKIWNILNESDDDDGSGAKRTKSLCCR